VAIEEGAFRWCSGLREVTFAADSKLRYISREAFGGYHLERVCLPASVIEIDPSAFIPGVWKILQFEKQSHILVHGGFLFAADSGTVLGQVGSADIFEVPAQFEEIGKNAFRGFVAFAFMFENGSRLREIGEEAFSESELRAVSVPSSVEILGDRCFENCPLLQKVTFEEPPRLKKIVSRAFARSRLQSFTIPALTNEIDGSALVQCPLEEIDIDTWNQMFIVRGNTVLTSDVIEIVKAFGVKGGIHVPSDFEILQKSCFELLRGMTELSIESVSKLRRISRSALTDCDSL
jgi:hypothetical protein